MAGLAATVVALAVCAVAAVVLTGGGGSGPARGGGATAAAASAHDPSVFDAKTLAHDAAAMTQRSPKPLDTTRLAAGLVPPTNRWFSALALGPTPQPVFPTPLSFAESGSGFAFGVPRVSTSSDTIAGPVAKDIVARVPGLASTVVSGYDDLTVTLELRSGDGSVIGHVVLAEGSPTVTFTAARRATVSMGAAMTGPQLTTTVDGRTYGATISGGSASGSSVDLDRGGRITWFAVPDGGSAATMARVVAPISGGHAAYTVDGDSATTRLVWDVPAGSDQVFAVLPHQRHGLAKRTACGLGTLPSIEGSLEVCRGSSLTWTAPVHPVRRSLDLSGLSDADRSTLAKQVRADVAAAPPFPADTYFGGKALQRSVQLYVLARQLGLTGVAHTVRGRLVDQLDTWTQPKGCDARPAFCFVYDRKDKGLIGMTPSFGSEQYNDHHFHYGYFLYTAGILAADDPGLATRWAPVMNLIAADIASNGATATFPNRRVFDPYAGHSWASGTAPFADGNNQESTSEAVNAWIGLSLWASATKNHALHQEATWMLSGEESTALAYGLRLDHTASVYDGFQHRIVSLTWGGKRDYATWFSPDPAAKLAIEVLPASPSTVGYLGGSGIDAAVREALDGRGYDRPFGDYLLMYAALAGHDQASAALHKVRSLPDGAIDDGNSRAYLLAWVMAARGS